MFSLNSLCNFSVSLFQNKQILILLFTLYLTFSSLRFPPFQTHSAYLVHKHCYFISQDSECLEPIHTSTMTSMETLVSYFFSIIHQTYASQLYLSCNTHQCHDLIGNKTRRFLLNSHFCLLH